MLFFKTTYHESRGVIRLAPKQHWSYFWVFWGKIQLSNGHKVSWFWVGLKILLDLIFPHVGLSSMPFWGQSEDPPTFMICGFKKEHMLITRFIYFLLIIYHWIFRWWESVLKFPCICQFQNPFEFFNCYLNFKLCNAFWCYLWDIATILKNKTHFFLEDKWLQP